mgnify:FL=1
MELNNKLFYQISLLHRVFRREAQNILTRELDVTLEMLSVLQILFEHGAIPQQQLADLLFIEKSSMKRNVDKLLAREYVAADYGVAKNKKLINLTAKGEMARAQGKEIMQQQEQAWLQQLSTEQQQSLMNNIATLLRSRIDGFK